MKNIIPIILVSFLALSSCDDDYIDPISEVAAGEDVSAPVITINSPAAGNATIPFTDTMTNQKFDYKVSDDIEIASVEIIIDGVKMATYNNFLDYRNHAEIYAKDLGLGAHTFVVNAKDKSGKSSSKSVTFNIDNTYSALYGEKAYFPFFAGNVFADLLSGANPTVIGTPSTVAGGKSGAAYQGATNSYLSVPLAGLYSNDNGMSFTFWYKVNSTPDRAGIITINDNTNDSDENRNKGFRLFREGGAASQTIKMNVGIGSGESWNDGGSIAVNGNWVHVGVTVSKTESKIYFDGVLQRTSTFSAFDFSESTTMVIGSGAPSFAYWNHLSDLSQIDELRIYDKALDENQVKATMQ